MLCDKSDALEWGRRMCCKSCNSIVHEKCGRLGDSEVLCCKCMSAKELTHFISGYKCDRDHSHDTNYSKCEEMYYIDGLHCNGEGCNEEWNGSNDVGWIWRCDGSVHYCGVSYCDKCYNKLDNSKRRRV